MFSDDANEVISIMDCVISNQIYYTDEERILIDKFNDYLHPESQNLTKLELIRIGIKYFAEINYKNYDDPQNKVLVNELLPKLSQIRRTNIRNAAKKLI